MGKAGSGKDCVINELKKVGFKQIVVYTSRPRRKGEREGREYHYISEEEFKNKMDNDFFVETKSYNVNGKTWWYGSPLNEIVDSIHDNKNHVIILTPKGVIDIINFLNKHSLNNGVNVVYLYANRKTILKRLSERKDTEDSVKRRMDSDDLDFKEAVTLSSHIVYNNDGDDIKDVAGKIISICEKNST